MNKYIIYIHNVEADEKYDMWYLHECDSPKEAAKSAWNMYNTGKAGIDYPEDYAIKVADVSTAQSGLVAIGNFSTGWLTVPSAEFTGDTV